MKATLDYCKQNDSYGLYEKAENNILKNMPGIDIDYQIPQKPNLVITPHEEEQIEQILTYLRESNIIKE